MKTHSKNPAGTLLFALITLMFVTLLTEAQASVGCEKLSLNQETKSQIYVTQTTYTHPNY